jgi:hypothetical protein
MSKEERNRVSEGMRHALFALVKSVKKHLVDGDKRRLRRRIKATLNKLYSIARKLKRLLPKRSDIRSEECDADGNLREACTGGEDHSIHPEHNRVPDGRDSKAMQNQVDALEH